MTEATNGGVDVAGAEASYVTRFVSDLPDAAVAVGPDGTITAANDLVRALLGYDPDDLIGRPVEVLVPRGARSSHGAWRRDFQAAPTARPMGGGMILEACCADDSPLAVEISLAPLPGSSTVAIIHDRSETVRARHALQDQLDVEMLAVSLSSRLAGAAGADLDRALDDALGEVCRLVGADHGLLYANSPDGQSLDLANEWYADDLDPTPGRIEHLPRGGFGWAGPLLEEGETVYVPNVDALPPDATTEARFMVEHGILSVLTIPLGAREEYTGTLSLRWRSRLADWDSSRSEIVSLLGNVFLAAHRRRQAEAVRDASEQRHRLLLDTLAAGVVLIRRDDGRIVSANPSAAHIIGVDLDELVGTDVLSAELELIGAGGNQLSTPQRRSILGADHHGLTRDLGIRRDHEIVWLEARAVGLSLAGEDHLAVSFIDVTERREAEELLVSRALHDPLTGLANRLLLGEHARAALARGARNGSSTAFVFFDLDLFKRVNDQHGHATGDELLSAVAHRLDAELRAGDLLARMGGDEFVAVLSDLSGEAEATVLAERFRHVLAEPIVVDGTTHRMSASIGIATADPAEVGHLSVDELLRRADQAMYAAKQSGRSRWVTWSDALVAAARHREDLEVELHQSLLNGDFTLRYQPVLDLGTGRLVGAEALVRWAHPDRGLLQPAEFLDIAEESGLIVALGQWVLEEACRAAREWPEDLWVSVNLSARQIGANDAAARVRRAIERTGLAPDRLHLELTETALIEGSHSVLTDIAAIRDLDVVLGLDDFGTGYSSMTYLHTLPLSFLKVDRSFVGELDEPAEHRASTIVDLVLRLAERFDLDVIAEGVETEAQAARLRDLGCRFVQGYLYDEPLDATELAGRMHREVLDR